MLQSVATRPADLTLRLPVPPSVNRIWRKGWHGRIHRTDEYDAWLRHAGWECAYARHGGIAYRFHMRVTLPEQRADADNLLKAVLDLLQRQKVIANDKHLRALAVEVDPDRPRDSLMLELWDTREQPPQARRRSRRPPVVEEAA